MFRSRDRRRPDHQRHSRSHRRHFDRRIGIRTSRPRASADRKWGTKDIAALWIRCRRASRHTCWLRRSSPGHELWQAVLTISSVTSLCSSHDPQCPRGTKYGIPFPVYCRASFGTLGANVPALPARPGRVRWFGIQAWIGGDAIYKILAVFILSWPRARRYPCWASCGAILLFPVLLCINIWVISGALIRFVFC